MVPVMYKTPAFPTDINNMLHTVPGTDSEHSIDSSDVERIVNIRLILLMKKIWSNSKILIITD